MNTLTQILNNEAEPFYVGSVQRMFDLDLTDASFVEGSDAGSKKIHGNHVLSNQTDFSSIYDLGDTGTSFHGKGLAITVLRHQIYTALSDSDAWKNMDGSRAWS